MRPIFQHPALLLVIFAGFTIWLGSHEQNKDFLAHQLSSEILRELESKIQQEKPVYFVADIENEVGKKVFEEAFFQELERRISIRRWEFSGLTSVSPPVPAAPFISARFVTRGHFLHVHVIGGKGKGHSDLWLDTERKVFYPTWISLVPMFFCLWLLLWRKRIVGALLGTIVMGALVVEGFDVFSASTFIVRTLIHDALGNRDHAWVLVFTACVVCLSHLSVMNGGVDGLARMVSRWSRGSRGAQGMSLLLSVLGFFHEYAGPLFSGMPMRGLFVRLGISRAKLAFLVNSMAVAVTSLALVSVWASIEGGVIDETLRTMGLSLSGLQFLTALMPYRIYCWSLLLLIAFSVFLKKDIAIFDFHRDLEERQERLGEGIEPRAYRLIVPIVTLVTLGLLGTFVHGFMVHEHQGLRWDVLWQRLSWTNARAWILSANIVFVLSLASITALFISAVLTWFAGVDSNEVRASSHRIVRQSLLPFGILFMGWALNAMGQYLRIADFVISIVPPEVNSRWAPMIFFLSSTLVAFMTGTGWGAITLLLPTAMKLGFQLGGEPLLYLCAASVLEGAIFGAHVSLLSPVTMLTSLTTGCDHWVHVRTQGVYAFIAAASTFFFGFILVPNHLPLSIAYVLSAATIVLVLTLFGEEPKAVLVAKEAGAL